MPDPDLPNYSLATFSRKDPDSLFYITPLEKLVKSFKEIDKPHAHTFYLVMWIAAGSGKHTIDFRTYDVTGGQLYFLTPGQVHSWQLSEDIRGFNLFFESHFFRSRFGNRLFRYPFFHSNQYQPLLSVTDQQLQLDTLLTYTYSEYSQHTPRNYELLLSYLHILLETSNRIYSKQLLDEKFPHYYDRIRQFEELIEDQLLRNRSIKAYADQMHLSPNHLNAICRRVLGKTASQLYQERLVTEAQRLLLHTGKSAKEISYLLGFEDSSYFGRFFKKHTGKTPSAFRLGE